MRLLRSAAPVAVVLSCLLAQVACSDDTTPNPSNTAATSGSSGANGASGSSGAAGSAGAAAAGGVGGSAGSSGTSGTSGTSGVSGTGGTAGVGCPDGAHEATNGSGQCESTLSGWAAGPLLKHKRDHHVTFVSETASGNYLFVAAGAGTGAAVKQIERSTIATDGSLGAFSDIGNLPEGLIGPGLAQVGSSVVIGGGLTNSSNSTTSTYVGKVADDGSVTFVKGPDLGASRYHVSFVAVKGFVFAIGGLFQMVDGSMATQNVVDTIERASFDGTTLGAFETLAPFPVKITHHATVVYNDAIYVIGGGTTAAALKDIRRATVSDTGDLGPWETVGQLTAGRASPSALVFLDQLYVIAGMTSLTGGEVDTVQRASLDDMGQVGTFEDLTPLPLARAHSHQTPFFQGHLYSAGGSIEHTPQADVFVGTLQ